MSVALHGSHAGATAAAGNGDAPDVVERGPATSGAHDAATYRPDVDGLRAIAVSLTVVFHLHLEKVLDGGFVGVDVFFVISGFLITGLLLRDLRGGTFSLLRFYERRVRRIVPALAALIGIVLVAGYVLLLPGSYRQMGRSALWALGAASNLFFLDNTGYFDADASTMPLLHTWSLGVEEQFYFVWPLLLLALFKLSRGRDRILALGIAGLIAASFALNLREIQTTPKAAFFLLKTRAWELGAGGLLALWPALGPGRARRALAEALPLLGLTMIGWAAATLASDQVYPGRHALLPVIGAMLVVYDSGHRTIARRMLGLRPLVFLGKISYSLYLVSWPLTVLWRTYTNGAALTPTAAGVLVVVSVVLAAASWRWIEQPFRRPTLPRRAVFLRAAVAVVVLVVAARTVVATGGFIGRIPESARGLGDLEVMWEWDCSEKLDLGLPREAVGAPAPTTCIAGAPWGSARTRAILWGDSFAEHLMPVLDAAGRAVGTSIALVPQCPAVFDDAHLRRYWPSLPQYNAACAAQRVALVRYLPEHDDVRVVVLASAWTTLASLLQDESGGRIPTEKGIPLMGEAFDRLLPQLAVPGRKIVLLGDTPRMPIPDPPGCAVAAVSPLLRDCPPDLGLITWQNLTGALAPVHAMMAEVAQRHPGTVMYRPQDHLCRDQHCDVEIDGEFLYRDGGHLRRNLTPEGTRKLAEKMRLPELLRPPGDTGEGPHSGRTTHAPHPV